MELRPPIVHSVFKREEFVARTVKNIGRTIQDCVEKKGSAFVGFSGAPSLFEVYANLGKLQWVDWGKVFFFAVDEAFVPGCKERGGTTRKAVEGSFNWPTESHMIFPGTKYGGVAECCRDYEDALESMLKVPDVVLLTVEEGRTAGIAAPVSPDNFNPDKLCVVSYTPSEFVPYTVSVSLGFLRKSKSIFFVLPTPGQEVFWREQIVGNAEKLKPADQVREYAAVSLIGHRNTSVCSIEPKF